jgi:tetratricopeptide (TPR) repeat protein
VLSAEPAFECPEPAPAWNETAQATTRTALQGVALSRATDVLSIVDQQLGERTTEWRAQWTAACDARASGQIGADAWQLRRDCLVDAQREVAGFVALLSDATPEELDGVFDLARTVGAGQGCREIEALAARAHPDAAQRTALDRSSRDRLRVHALLAAGQYDRVLTETPALLADARQIGFGPVIADVLLVRARAAIALGRPEAHEEDAREAMRLAANARDATTEAYAHATLLAILAGQPDRAAEARGLIPATEAAAERAGDPAALAYQRLVVAYALQSADPDGARAALDDALESLEADPHASAELRREAYARRGELKVNGGDLEGAATDYDRARGIAIEAMGPHHPAVGQTLAEHATALMTTERFADAQPMFVRAAAALEDSLGRSHPLTNNQIIQAARALMHMGDNDAARRVFVDALDRLRDQGDDQPAVESPIVENLAWLEATAGHDEEAIAYYLRAATLLPQVGDPAAERLPGVEQALGWSYWRQQDMPNARVHFERARTLLVERHGPKHPSVLEQTASIGDTYKKEGDCAGAQTEYRRALRLLTDLDLPPGAHLARLLVSMGECELSEDDLVAARDTLERAHALKDTPGLGGDWRAPILFAYGRLHAREGDRRRGVQLARDALALYRALPVQYVAEMDEIETWLQAHGAATAAAPVP